MATSERSKGGTRGRPAKPTGEGTQVRIDSDLVSMARYLAAKSDESITKLLSDLLRPMLQREFAKAARDLMPDVDK